MLLYWDNKEIFKFGNHGTMVVTYGHAKHLMPQEGQAARVSHPCREHLSNDVNQNRSKSIIII